MLHLAANMLKMARSMPQLAVHKANALVQWGAQKLLRTRIASSAGSTLDAPGRPMGLILLCSTGALMLLLPGGLPLGSRNSGPPESPAQVRPTAAERKYKALASVGSY